MSFNSKVEHIPSQPFSDNAQNASDVEHQQYQKRKWRVLLGTFLIIMIVSNGIIWSQPAIYQSQAILHFSYPSQTEQEFGELAQRQITLHAKRLTSSSVLSLVSQELEQNQFVTISAQSLFDSLDTEASLTGRIISLKASGPEPVILKSIADAWVKVYLALIDSERRVNYSDDQLTADNQLLALEQKIVEQKQRVETFAQVNNITSLERDENRVLSKVKNLSASLDNALAERTGKTALLESITQSISNGEYLIRPQDKPTIDNLRKRIREITADLEALSERYTQAYLERDSAIVARQQELESLKTRLKEQIRLSKINYLQDVERELQTAKNKVERLQEQLEEQSALAQTFSQDLEEFEQLDSELKVLQAQAQNIKTQSVAREVTRPFEAKISVLEQPSIPDFSIGPNYKLESLISLIGSAVIAILALFLFSFIAKQKTPQSISSNYVVIPGQNVGQGYVGLSQPQPEQLSHVDTQPPSQLSYSPQAQRLLTEGECQSLFAVANNQGKALIGLVLCGVSLDELGAIKKKNFQDNYTTLELGRRVPLPLYLVDVCKAMTENLAEEEVIWTNLDPERDFAQVLINTAHDAQLSSPEQLPLQSLRHTYLTFLVNQGVKLNEIESIAGYTSPSELGQYRHVANKVSDMDLENVITHYPLTKDT